MQIRSGPGQMPYDFIVEHSGGVYSVVLDLVARHVRGKVWHVPEDPEDLLVAQPDVMEERDDREAAHVRHVLVVLDLREEVVHARREAGDAHLADVCRLEGRLLRLE